MNLLKRKMQVFCISNMVVSFVCTGFIGTNYYGTYETELLANNESVIADNDVEPASQLGDRDEKNVTDEKLVKSTTTVKEVTNKSTAKKSVTTNVVKKQVVAKTTTYVPAKYSEVTGNAIVNYAKKYLGLRYVSGGNSLSTGTDCSGFTKLIYKEFGVTLSRTVLGQVGNGKYVSKSDLQKGDLVFYSKGGSTATHVAIYIGNNQVIHESNHRDGVKISSVNMMRYITARRVINDAAIYKVETQVANEKREEVTTQNSDNVVLDTDNETTKNNENNDIVEVVNNENNIAINDNNDVQNDTSTNNSSEEQKEEAKKEESNSNATENNVAKEE